MTKSFKEVLNESRDGFKIYIASEWDRYRLLFVKIASGLITSDIKLVVAVAASAIAAFFLLLSLAIYWGEQIGSYPLGFLYTGLVSLGLLALVLLLAKHIIRGPIMRRLLRELFK